MNSTTPSNNAQLYILTNSPGELASWVTPITHTIKELAPEVDIHILLTPCQYASGNERDVALSLPNVVSVKAPKETLSGLFSLPLKTPLSTPGAVLSLGGDPMYAKLYSKKLGIPGYIYTEREDDFGPALHTFKKSEVGDLMYDKVQLSRKSKADILNEYNLEDRAYTLFFPGSRPQHFSAFLPFLCDTIQLIRKRTHSFKAIINVSPFISNELLEKVKANCNTDDILFLKAPSIDMIQIAELQVSLPGTNTAEAMYVETPMIVIAPLNKPELIILDGLAGLITKTPLLGPLLLRVIIKALKKKIKYVSLPNRKANEAIVPEIVDTVTESTISDTVIKYLTETEHLYDMKQRLKSLRETKKPSETIVKTLLNTL
jgi:lipid-A-disaccharide synthase